MRSSIRSRVLPSEHDGVDEADRRETSRAPQARRNQRRVRTTRRQRQLRLVLLPRVEPANIEDPSTPVGPRHTRSHGPGSAPEAPGRKPHDPMELAGFGRRLARNLEGEQGPTQTIAVEDHRHADVGCRPGDQIVIQGTVSRNAPRIAQRSPATDGGADHVLRRHPLDPVDGMLVALRLDGQPETRFRRVDGRRQGRWQLRVEATGAVETIDPDRPIEVLGTVLTIIRRPRARSTLPIAQRESTMT